MTRLTSQSLAEIKSDLLARRASLAEEIREELVRTGEAHYADIAGRVTDPGDESVADLLSDLDASFLDRHLGEARRIEAALSRIANHDYGVCSDCGSSIPVERLRVNPVAERCIACQESSEHGLGAGPTL